MVAEHKVGYFFIVMASVVIVLAGVKSASSIVVPILLSLFIAIILSPSYNFFRKKGIPDILSLFIVISVFLFFIVLIAKLIGTSVNDFSANIDLYSEKLSLYYKSIINNGEFLGITLPMDMFSNIIDSKKIMLFATAIFKSMSSMVTNGFVILLSVTFMLLESKHFAQKIEMADHSKDTTKQIEEIFSKIKSYMVIKALISLLTGFIIWVALVFIGTDYAFLWAVLAFLLNFVPNIGSIIAAVPAVMITLVQLGGLSAFFVALLYLGVNIIIGSVLEPRIMGRGLGLSTLVVFLSLLFWGWLLGIVGMLLSIPLTIMAKITFDANENTEWISILLGSGERGVEQTQRN